MKIYVTLSGLFLHTSFHAHSITDDLFRGFSGAPEVGDRNVFIFHSGDECVWPNFTHFVYHGLCIQSEGKPFIVYFYSAWKIYILFHAHTFTHVYHNIRFLVCYFICLDTCFLTHTCTYRRTLVYRHNKSSQILFLVNSPFSSSTFFIISSS